MADVKPAAIAVTPAVLDAYDNALDKLAFVLVVLASATPMGGERADAGMFHVLEDAIGVFERFQPLLESLPRATDAELPDMVSGERYTLMCR